MLSIARLRCLQLLYLVFLAVQFFGDNTQSSVFGQDRYCGIYAVYGAGRTLGAEISFSTLVSPRFVSSVQGSSIDDLVRAIDHVNLKCKVFSGLGYRSISGTSCPLILHVCSEQQFVAYNHWLLFLGISNGSACIADSDGGPRLVPIGELLARWDGVAIAVFQNNGDKNEISGRKKNELFQWVAVCALIVALLLKVQHPVRCLLVLCGGLMVVLHIATPVGFGRNSQVLSMVETVIRSDNYQQVEYEWVVQYCESKNITLFDVRYQEDSARQMIPGAIALPIDALQSDFEMVVASVPRDRTVVVYCQSRQCSFSRIMAIRLMEAGFTRIHVYSGGYKEWAARRPGRSENEVSR
jgi:rhodanese-related sulfurtransferase